MRRIAGFATLSLLALIAALAPALADSSSPIDFASRGINEGLDRSPEDYVAALVEVVGTPECDGPPELEQCRQRVRIARLFASKRGGRSWNEEFDLLGAGSVGERMLVFAVPIMTGAKIYGSTFASSETGPELEQGYAEVVSKLGL